MLAEGTPAPRDAHHGALPPSREVTVHTCVPLVITGERTVPGVWHENYWVSVAERCAPVRRVWT
ncbi:hypothetical protein GCM10027080_00530 [Pedococcus soli]